MALQYFTLVHILISLIGIAAGFGMLAGLMFDRLFRGWTAVFIAMTLLTSITGFLFPFNGVTPGIVLGVISVVTLAVASLALYVQHLAGVWRRVFTAMAVVSLYFNCFVLIAQTFQKNPALVKIAPTQAEPAFAVTQLAVLLVFVALGVSALRRFRN